MMKKLLHPRTIYYTGAIAWFVLMFLLAKYFV